MWMWILFNFSRKSHTNALVQEPRNRKRVSWLVVDDAMWFMIGWNECHVLRWHRTQVCVCVRVDCYVSSQKWNEYAWSGAETLRHKIIRLSQIFIVELNSSQDRPNNLLLQLFCWRNRQSLERNPKVIQQQIQSLENKNSNLKYGVLWILPDWNTVTSVQATSLRFFKRFSYNRST